MGRAVFIFERNQPNNIGGDRIDAFTGCDLLVHYGHSCLVPIQDTEGIAMLYVFVNIDINLSDFIDAVKVNFKKENKLALVSTIQFVASLQVSFVSIALSLNYLQYCSVIIDFSVKLSAQHSRFCRICK